MACSIFSGQKLTNAQIRQYARAAGWPETLIPLIAAVSIAESSGYTGAQNICGEHSVGLLQVNQDSHNYSTSVLSDPLSNLKIGYEIYKREGANAWVNSWIRGGWKKYAVGDELGGQATIGTGAPTASTPTFDFSQYLGVSVIGDKNRYLLAFAILVIIFIFAFN